MSREKLWPDPESRTLFLPCPHCRQTNWHRISEAKDVVSFLSPDPALSDRGGYPLSWTSAGLYLTLSCVTCLKIHQRRISLGEPI